MTVQDVIDQFRIKYPACTDDYALTLFNQTHREFASRSQIRNKWEYIELTAGVTEYDMPDGVKMIHESYYMPSSTPSSWFPLVNMSIDKFIVESPGWRLTAENRSQPTVIYTTSAPESNGAKPMLGVWLAPQTTTDVGTGYPLIGLWVTSTVDMAADDDIPTNILTELVYVYGMYAKWSMQKQPEDYAMMRQLAEEQMNANVEFVKGLQVHSQDEVISRPNLRVGRVI